MQFNYAYAGSTAIDNSANQTAMAFAPDLKREPTYFIGELRQGVAFREAISALHAVVVSDLRFKPKDHSAYKAWAEQREQEEWGQLQAQIGQQYKNLAARQLALSGELIALNKQFQTILQPFYEARQKYFSYLYEKEKDKWFVLDPVITVHPDEVFFECFSQDESSYGRLSVDYDVFQNINEFQCGTTNIDYSATLYNEFQKIRSYKSTQFTIDPTGFQVQTTHEENYHEVKIDLPDSWVRGFLQVNSAMALPAVQFDLHPMDVHNICLFLRRHKEKRGPRSLRYCLTPNQPIIIKFDPWGTEIKCPRSLYLGDTAQEIRVWGRRRLHILERLIPIAQKFTVHLLGTGMPSFYVADLGNMWFTLGLSGWTANDWSSSSNFDLLAPRVDVDSITQHTVFNALSQTWFAKPDVLASQLKLDRAQILGALGMYTQAGRAIFDVNKQVYRRRELTRDPLPMETLRFANPREESAMRFLTSGSVNLKQRERDTSGAWHLQGTVKDRSKTHHPSLTIDADERITKAECTCNWHQQNKLFKGACEHILALRLFHARH